MPAEYFSFADYRTQIIGFQFSGINRPQKTRFFENSRVVGGFDDYIVAFGTDYAVQVGDVIEKPRSQFGGEAAAGNKKNDRRQFANHFSDFFLPAQCGDHSRKADQIRLAMNFKMFFYQFKNFLFGKVPAVYSIAVQINYRNINLIVIAQISCQKQGALGRVVWRRRFS